MDFDSFLRDIPGTSDENVVLLCERGMALNESAVRSSNMGEFGKALAVYEHAVSLDPNYGSAWLGKVVALTGLGRYEEALASCERAIAIYGRTHDKASRANAREAKAMILDSMGRKSEAQQAQAMTNNFNVQGSHGRDFFRFVGPIGWLLVLLYLHVSTGNGWAIGLFLVPLAVCVLVAMYYTDELLSPLSLGGLLALAAIPWIVGYNVFIPHTSLGSTLWTYATFATCTGFTILIEGPKLKPNTALAQSAKK